MVGTSAHGRDSRPFAPHARREEIEGLGEVLVRVDVLMKGRTSFVIAQRISTVMNADKIIVLDRGEVVAIGKHTDLLEDNPVYAEIYNSQILTYEAEHAAAKEGAL